MTLGNLVALTQDNVKRMLAYSSIAHTGYMLVGLAAYAGGQHATGSQGLLFYGAAYAFMNLGAFAVIAALQKRTGVTSASTRSPGSGRREPLLGGLMTLFLLSLTGIPPTAGFFAKAYVILAAVEAGGCADGPGRASRCSTPRSPRSTTCGSSSTCSCATRRATRRRCATARCCGAGWRRRPR